MVEVHAGKKTDACGPVQGLGKRLTAADGTEYPEALERAITAGQ